MDLFARMRPEPPVTGVRISTGLKNERVQGVPVKEKPSAPPDLFELHTLAAFVGQRGSGKTNACVLLAKQYYEARSFNRIFIISPTYESNPVFTVLPTIEGDIYKDGMRAQAALTDILSKIEEDVRDWSMSEEYKKIYAKHERGDPLTQREITIFEIMRGEKPRDLEKPSPLVIIDDMSHSDIYSTSGRNPFINLCLRHRHVHGVGLSIFMLVQTFRSGIPRGLRQNVQLWFIWRTQDRQQIEAMYEEFSGYATREQFENMYAYATRNPHDFLTVDVNASPEAHFRKNFDELLVAR